jgi:hypothetical protein
MFADMALIILAGRAFPDPDSTLRERIVDAS